MRIRRQARRVAQLVTEILELLFAQPAFQKRARIHARRSVALEVNQVARLIAVAGVEEVIESHFQQRGQRGIGRNVSANAGVFLVLAMHHGHGVPADQALDAPLQLAVARIGHFFRRGDGVQVGRVELHWHIDAGRPGALYQGTQQLGPLLGPSSSTTWSKASSHSATSC